MSAEPEHVPLPPSPCVGICALQGAYCYGCGRTGDEIAAWGTMSPLQQSAVWAELPGRLAGFGFKTFRLAAGPAVVNAFIGRTFRETTGRWRIVSAGLEAGMTINANDRLGVDESADDVVATAANGDRIAFQKHDKVRVFGFSSNDDAPQMDTVVLVLPKGRAQRDLKSRDGFEPSSLELPFAEVITDSVGAGADLESGNSEDAGAIRQRLDALLAGATTSVMLRNAIGWVTTEAADVITHDQSLDANAPPGVKISKAFVACAIFHADDPDWLAAALAP